MGYAYISTQMLENKEHWDPVASFPGPAQLSIASSTVKQKKKKGLVKATESWAGPGNEDRDPAQIYWMGNYPICRCCCIEQLLIQQYHRVNCWLEMWYLRVVYLGFFTSTLSRMKSLQSGERCANSTHSVSSFRALMLAMVASCVGPTNGDLPVSLQWGKGRKRIFTHTQ